MASARKRRRMLSQAFSKWESGQARNRFFLASSLGMCENPYIGIYQEILPDRDI
jgi:hypothetical protein